MRHACFGIPFGHVRGPIQPISLRSLSQTHRLRQQLLKLRELGDIIPLIVVNVTIGQILLHGPLFQDLVQELPTGSRHLRLHDTMKSGIPSLHTSLLFNAKVDDRYSVFRQKSHLQTYMRQH